MLGQLGEARDDALRLGGEVDVARAGKRCLLRAVCDEQLHGPLQPVEQLAHLGFVLRPKDRHHMTIGSAR